MSDAPTVLHADFGASRSRRLDAAERVSVSLIEAEEAFDIAIGKLLRLGIEIAEARGPAGVAAEVIQRSIDGVTETLTAATTARRSLMNTHRRLAAVQHAIGLGEINFGPGTGKPLPVIEPITEE